MEEPKEIRQLRKKTIFYYTAIFVGSFAFFIFFLTVTASESEAELLAMIILLFAMMFCLFVRKTTHEYYIEEYKNWLCNQVVRSVFDVEEYDPSRGFPERFVNETNLLPSGLFVNTDDYIKGSYNDIPFERSDVHVETLTYSGKRVRRVTLFLGTWTIFTVAKPISKLVIIREKKFWGSLGFERKTASGNYKAERVKLESILFNDDFEVFSEDEEEAFYVLNPAFMEKMSKLERAVEGHMIVAVIKDKIHVIFDTRKNILKPRLFDSNPKIEFDLMAKELQHITLIADLLKENVVANKK